MSQMPRIWTLGIVSSSARWSRPFPPTPIIPTPIVSAGLEHPQRGRSVYDAADATLAVNCLRDSFLFIGFPPSHDLLLDGIPSHEAFFPIGDHRHYRRNRFLKGG